MRKEALIGVLLIIIGIGVFIYYDMTVRPEYAARELLVEGQIAFEQSTKESINQSINIFSRVIARYPETTASMQAYYFIGQGYEKLGLNRLAYLKYIYILKTSKKIPANLKNELNTRIARLTIMKQYTEEGIHQLLGMLGQTDDRDMRSRVYTELGHAYLRLKSYNKAQRMFDIAITENGNNEEAIIGKARAYKHLGQDSKAYDLYEYFLQYYGNFSHFTGDTRNAYLRQVYDSGYRNYKAGRFYPAISFFRRLLSYFPGVRKSEDALYMIGESFYSLQKYDDAISYFDRTLNNGYTHRDEEARMKKGYAYFMGKKFDLAAREFQVYMDKYPSGKYSDTAKKWYTMSTKEIMYRLKDNSIDENIENEYDQEADEASDSETGYEGSRNGPRGVGAEYPGSTDAAPEFENVAEL